MANTTNSPAASPERVGYRTVGEWELQSSRSYARPFADLALEAIFTSPTGRELRMPGFHDGDGTWRVRFSPGEIGRWTYKTAATPEDPGLTTDGKFEATAREARGFLRSTPGEAWGFAFENGDPAFIFGDTTYNLFGMAHCGIDVQSFLRRRAEQGFNLLRVRLPVSPFHPPKGYSDWQTRRTWPWGGSEQSPRFDEFNLEYFRTVDEVVRLAEELGIGLEMIMEAWGFEFPFNSRQIFTAEWEELWLRYLIARYDAFSSTWVWTPLNEYEYYPNGDWHYTPNADRWQLRISRWIKANAPHGHVVVAHNGPRVPPFAQRFAADPEAVDAIMFQEWGTTGERDAWLAAGIEESIDQSLAGWRGSAVLAEWGYERNPEFELRMPGHRYCDTDHTRRGAWRGVFRGLGIVHGFENSWGPWEKLDEDQPGLEHLLHVNRFVTELVPFDQLRPAPEVLGDSDTEGGHRPLALANEDRSIVAVYLPTGGRVSLQLKGSSERSYRWFDPRTGKLQPADIREAGEGVEFIAPAGGEPDRPWDWVLVRS
ncbi:MAG TPA: DUF4038 domain-containing protein [Thermomicrobiales bacterium]|nr:DUF4038 domain-containing protein [Thermomicrobiales bacterium]